jgi:cytochrome c556
MTHFGNLRAWAVAGTLFLAGTALAQVDIGSMTAEEVVSLRVETMRLNGATMRGADALTGAEAIATGEQLLANARLLKLLFPEGSNRGNSNALDLIWSDWDNFIAILDKLEMDAQAMVSAAQAGDQTAYLAAVTEAGSNCNTCHSTYRAPL